MSPGMMERRDIVAATDRRDMQISANHYRRDIAHINIHDVCDYNKWNCSSQSAQLFVQRPRI